MGSQRLWCSTARGIGSCRYLRWCLRRKGPTRQEISFTLKSGVRKGARDRCDPYHILHYALRLRLLGPGPGIALSNRLVRRIAVDADTDYPHHPHQPHSVSAELGLLAAHCDHRDDHASRRLVALLTSGASFWIYAVARSLLAAARSHLGRLCC